MADGKAQWHRGLLALSMAIHTQYRERQDSLKERYGGAKSHPEPKAAAMPASPTTSSKQPTPEEAAPDAEIAALVAAYRRDAAAGGES